MTITGAVQGVGFRPAVYRLATRLGLAGSVRNTGAGVEIDVEGDAAALAALREGLAAIPPPARVERVVLEVLAPSGACDFRVVDSTAGPGGALPLPDLAPCAACLAELADPADRRFGYPFISCSQCGPRYSLITAPPYDRERTAMAPFTLCPACAAEYHDPASRRFRHEANACPACGPQLEFCDAGGGPGAAGEAALAAAVALLQAGGIVALKGAGGFQLLTDARDAAAIARLRERKRRPHKPLAVMFPGLKAVGAVCRVSAAERALLESPAAPIVLLDSREHVRASTGRAMQEMQERTRMSSQTLSDALPATLAPGSRRLGVMLASTPLHVLLLTRLGFPVVATSGNASGEPLCADNAEALERLAGIADGFLLHDRDIVNPVDDSVLQIAAGRAQVLRLARGLAPLTLPDDGDGAVLALGGELKSALAVGGAGRIVAGPYLGDLDTLPALVRFDAASAVLPALAGVVPRRLACDAHPDYASSRRAAADPRPVIAVQHHHAHVAAVLAEHGVRGELLGVAFDGAGLGDDGTLWGGEFLWGDRAHLRRVATLRPFPLPGGARAAREPRRAALGLLYAAFGRDLGGVTLAFAPAEQGLLLQALGRGVNAPPTSSVGRLFDAVAALLGLSQVMSYEGQAAAALQTAAETAPAQPPYPLPLLEMASGLLADWLPMLEALLAERAAGVPVAVSAGRFHATLAVLVAGVARRLSAARVALAGGCFQNRHLLALTCRALRDAGIAAFWPQRLPPGDGALAVGQAAVARWRHNHEEG
ncbi:MAG: carbamoyltransferase HypF [Immundisolibacter sp.]|nr:carbamoyltransferase HypF [Immundisolibacter sp.]